MPQGAEPEQVTPTLLLPPVCWPPVATPPLPTAPPVAAPPVRVPAVAPPLAFVVPPLPALLPPEAVPVLPPVLMRLQLRMAEPGGPLHEHAMPEELVHDSPGVGQEIPCVQSRMLPSRAEVEVPPLAPPAEPVRPALAPALPPLCDVEGDEPPAPPELAVAPPEPAPPLLAPPLPARMPDEDEELLHASSRPVRSSELLPGRLHMLTSKDRGR